MTIFNHYAHYYDLLYKDKDYTGEAQYISDLIKHHQPNTQSLLELGCGTGRHAAELAKLGYHIHGIDISEKMINHAKLLFANLPDSQRTRLSCTLGDLRNLRLSERYDAVISLFHVMSYQTTNQDFCKSLITARDHLKQNGIFIFDCWYGPAVLTDPPIVRIKELEDDQLKIIRIAKPIIYPNRNVVDVNYKIILIDKKSSCAQEIIETHTVRYLFQPEITEFFGKTGFKQVICNTWLSNQPASLDSWNVVFVAKRM